MFEAKLIALYSYVEERYEAELKYHCMRFSNNSNPIFSDVEAITVYLYCVREEKRLLIKDIHRFANRYLLSWFPRLPSYQAFNNRMNRLCSVLQHLSQELILQNIPADADRSITLTDSVPIITCSGKRDGKVARSITAKGFCSTKGIYYYGLKLHLSGHSRTGTLPYPCSVVLSGAQENDLTVLKEHDSHHSHSTLFADKAYRDKAYWARLFEQKRVAMLTPAQPVKGQSRWQTDFDRAGNDLYSRAVSRIRQPVESLFNWLIEHTDIQRASKVRSTKGLLVHVFGKLAAAFSYIILNP